MPSSPSSDEFFPDFLHDAASLKNILNSTGIGVWEVRIDSNTVSWDKKCQALFGIFKENNIPYNEAIKYIHPDDVKKVNNAVNRALKGDNEGKYDMTYRTLGAEDGKLRHVNFIGKALFNAKGEVYRFAGIAKNVTEEKLHEKLRITQKESEYYLQSLIQQAPMAIGVLKGRDLIVETGNDKLFEIWGKPKSFKGKKLIEVLPEIKDQGFLELLDNVYSTGVPYHGNNTLVKLVQYGVLTDVYVDFVFAPFLDGNEKIIGIIALAIDVTSEVVARQKVEEAESFLRSAVELAELGTWSLDLKTGILDYSPRLRNWFGLDNEEVITIEKAYEVISEEHRSGVKKSMLHAITPGSDGIYHVEYSVSPAYSNTERFILAQGKAIYDESGNPFKVSGTARDITEQRKIQWALERQVQKRTAELDEANQDLSASNQSLKQSNKELEQFAYVASHDLQEPLRKIRVFISKLLTQSSTTSPGYDLLSKIKLSAERMMKLINNILEFSRLLEYKDVFSPVNLSDVLEEVMDDFELTIHEKKARIDLKSLPVIHAIELQMHQLFHNLMSNALKFSETTRSPHLIIESRQLEAGEISEFIPDPFPETEYFLIHFTDNGIGFDLKYSDRIFEIFKRLHGREEYSGTGIGLSLCKRIVHNHKGYLSVKSTPGSGSTFIIVLPATQGP